MTLLRSLRSRLTAVFVAGATLTLLVASLGMNALIARAVWGPLDAELGEEAETVCSLIASAAVDDLRVAVSALQREKEPGPAKFIRVARADGAVLAESGVLPPGIEIGPPTEGRTSQTVRVGAHRPFRVVWYGSNGCRVVIGVRGEYAQRLQRNAQGTIAATASGLLLVLAFLAWSITGRATEELARLAAEVETVEAGSLARRLGPRQTLEVDRIATVLNRLLARLDSAMTHLRRFTIDAAHELRTPIAGLRARLEGTLGGPRGEQAYRDGLLDALEHTERLGSLAEHLLTLSAIESGIDDAADEPVRLDALAHEVAEALEPVAQEQGRRFECLAPGPVIVPGRPQMLKRVLLNLVHNAFRHTPGTSAVRLAVRTDRDTAVAEVTDDGPGMAAQDVERSFERFKRGGGAKAGSGLGLALCREIVTRHRGTIVMESSPRGGTTVTVRLPM